MHAMEKGGLIQGRGLAEDSSFNQHLGVCGTSGVGLGVPLAHMSPPGLSGARGTRSWHEGWRGALFVRSTQVPGTQRAGAKRTWVRFAQCNHAGPRRAHRYNHYVTELTFESMTAAPSMKNVPLALSHACGIRSATSVPSVAT